jgi:hypothetical protein
MKKQDSLDDNNYMRFYELIQMRTGIRVGENRREVLSQAIKENLESFFYIPTGRPDRQRDME